MSPGLGLSLTLFLGAVAVPVLALGDAANPKPTTAPVAAAPRTIAVLPVDEPDHSSPPDLLTAAHALRQSLRERQAGVLSGTELRRRFVGAEKSLPELERAYAGAQAAYQADELDSAVRILGSVIAELEELPESAGAYDLWLRAQLRLALAERARRHPADATRAMERILALEPAFAVDPDQFAPSFRRDFDEVRRRVQQAPRFELTLRSRGAPVVAWVDGKELGPTPVTVRLPPGRYRARGLLTAAGAAAPRTPRTIVTLAEEAVTIDLDVPLAEAVRLDPAPVIGAPARSRGATMVAVGDWLRSDEVIAVERIADGGPLIAATLYDVRRGTLVREARAPVVSGSLRPESVNALASFVLTGERSSVRIDLTTSLQPPPARPRWVRPAAYAAGVAAIAAGTYAVLQLRAWHDRSAEANGMVRSDGALLPGTDRSRYDAAIAAGDAAKRNAYVAGASAVVVAIGAAILGYQSLDARAGPVLAPAIRF